MCLHRIFPFNLFCSDQDSDECDDIFNECSDECCGIMCFEERDSSYYTRTSIRNGVHYHERVALPRHRSHWQRRFGASYYPSRYYSRPPRPFYGSPMPARYAANVGIPRAIAAPAVRHHPHVHGYGRYISGGRAAMPSAYNMRSYYTSMPTFGMPYNQTAYVVPPGPTHTTTTTYHVTNSHATAAAAAPVSAAPPAPVRAAHCAHNVTREDIQMENRRIATERGAYSARRIKPADARDDDPFWCRERNGEWHLRTFYQIENECYPGQWLMDAELGFLVFHRG